MDYDRTKIPDQYNKGRDHGPDFLEQWMTLVARHLINTDVRDILDLGCGTGRFSNGLAARFDATLLGIDPSTKMLQQARACARGRIWYTQGLAEAIPLPDNSIDLIFISMVFHHFTDPAAAAEECKRVLRPDGRVCLRTASADKIPLYPYVPFFPASVPLLQERLPSLDAQRRIFEEVSFQTLSCEVVTQQIAPNYSVYADKLSTKSDSILASLADNDFEAGLQALRSEAAMMKARPVTEPIDFLVFGNSGSNDTITR